MNLDCCSHGIKQQKHSVKTVCLKLANEAWVYSEMWKWKEVKMYIEQKVRLSCQTPFY